MAGHVDYEVLLRQYVESLNDEAERKAIIDMAIANVAEQNEETLRGEIRRLVINKLNLKE